MSITTKNKHDHCEVFIDCNTTNAHGQPALMCKNHTVTKGKRAGLPAVVQWISRQDFALLYADPDIHIVGDAVPHLRTKPTMTANEYTQGVRRGQLEPVPDVSCTFTRPRPFWS